jgi:hypothetical protein
VSLVEKSVVELPKSNSHSNRPRTAKQAVEIRQIFHDQVVPNLLFAAFLLESMEEERKKAGVPKNKQLEKARKCLRDAFGAMVEAVRLE